MDRRKLESAALFVTLFGTLLFMPPLMLVFAKEGRLFGVPDMLLYLFAAWAMLIAVAFWLGKRLPPDPPPGGGGG